MIDRDRDEFVAHARRNAQVLTGIDLDAPLDDLAPLATTVGHGRIVGVGESWHHAHQLLKVKFRLVRFMVERLGFDTVVFEGSLSGSEPIDRYVQGGVGDAGTVLPAFGQPMWLNPETVEFIDWLRARNARVPTAKKVRIRGMDVGYPAAAILGVLDYLDTVDRTYLVPDRDLVVTIARRLEAVRFGSLTKSAMYGSSDVYDDLDAVTKTRFRTAFRDIVARLVECRGMYVAASSHTDYAVALRHATLVLQAHDVIDARSGDLGLANARRDFAFAENVAWIAEHSGRDARLVVLAHNMHVARDPFRSDPHGPDITSMGGHLAQWYGTNYVAIGTAVGRGRVRGTGSGLVAAASHDDPVVEARASATIDAALEDVGYERFLLDVRTAGAWARQPRGMRTHLEPQPDYVLSRAFDAVAYVDQIVRAVPIDSGNPCP